MNLDVIGYILYSGLGMLILAFLFLLSSMVNKPQKVTHNLYDEAVSDYEEDYEDDSEYETEEYEAELNTYSPEKERKSIFGLKRNNRKRNYEEDYYKEESNEEINLNNDDEESFYEENFNINTSKENYTEEKFNPSNPEEYSYEDDGIEDEFESDFEFIESITKKGKKETNDYDLFEEDNFNAFSNIEDKEDIQDYTHDKKETFNIDDEDDDYSDFEFEEGPKEEERKGITIKKYEDTYEDLKEDYDVEKAMLKRFKAYKNSINK